MPITNLIYRTTVSSNWGGNDINRIETDNGQYANADAVGQIAIVNLTALPADVATINSVTLKLIDAFVEIRGGSGQLATAIQAADGSTLYTDTPIVNDSFVTYTLNERTTSDGSAAWTLSDINNIRILLKAQSANPNIGAGMQLDFLQLVVDYNIAVVAPYDSTVNDIHVTSGNIDVSSGNIFI